MKRTTARALHPNTPRAGPTNLDVSASRAAATLALALACAGCSGEHPQTPQVSEAQLRAELTPLVRDQLREELRPVVLEELRRELTGPGATAPTATRPLAGGEPDATPDTTPSTAPNTAPTPFAPPSAEGDLWNRPGTTIWPSPGGLRLVELSVGTGLEEKLPVGIASHYQEIPEILFCYTVFENPGPEQTVTHVWRRSGRLVSRVELEVGNSPKWRTWSKQRTAPNWRGVWSCEVLSPDGTQLGLHVFQVGG